MKEKIILTDCDGVSSIGSETFMQWMSHNGMNPQGEDWKLKYKVSERYGVTQEEGNRLTSQFNSSVCIGFMHSGTQWFIKKLNEQHGIKFVAVTSLHDDPYVSGVENAEPKETIW